LTVVDISKQHACLLVENHGVNILSRTTETSHICVPGTEDGDDILSRTRKRSLQLNA